MTPEEQARAALEKLVEVVAPGASGYATGHTMVSQSLLHPRVVAAFAALVEERDAARRESAALRQVGEERALREAAEVALAKMTHERDEWRGRAADRNAEAEKYSKRAWAAEAALAELEGRVAECAQDWEQEAAGYNDDAAELRRALPPEPDCDEEDRETWRHIDWIKANAAKYSSAANKCRQALAPLASPDAKVTNAN